MTMSPDAGGAYTSVQRPRSRGHTINGTEKEIAFHRARATLRLLNNETPPVHDGSTPTDIVAAAAAPFQSKAQFQHKRNYRRRRRNQPKRHLPAPRRRGRQQQQQRRQNASDLNEMISELWSLQANKPAWLTDPTSEEAKAAAARAYVPPPSPLTDKDFYLRPPNTFDDPKVLKQVHKTLQLHPSASHIENSLLRLHLQGAPGADADLSTAGSSQITSWMTHKYPLLLQRDAFRENQAIITIARAFRAYQSRCAFTNMLNLQRTRVAAAICIQHSWAIKQLRDKRRAEARRIAPLLVRSVLREVVGMVIDGVILRREEERLAILHARQRERDRLLREQTGRSKRERECRSAAACKIQRQWIVYSWRRRNDLFFMYRQVQHIASIKVQTFARAKLRRIAYVRERSARRAAAVWRKKVIYMAATKIQRLVLRARGYKWQRRMRFGVDVRDLLGADEDLPFEPSEAAAKVRDFFRDKDFGKPDVMAITGTGRKYYTGGVFSQMGSRAPGRNLTPGQRAVRVRQAQIELASVQHSVGKLDCSEAMWTLVVQDLLEVEWQNERTKQKENAKKAAEAEAQRKAQERANQILLQGREVVAASEAAAVAAATTTASAAAAAADAEGDATATATANTNTTTIDDAPRSVEPLTAPPTGSELFAKLMSPPEKYAELGSGTRLSGLMITLLTHLMLVYQCRGRFEIADRLLHHDLLGKEYANMMKKVRMADAFRRRNLLRHYLELWKKAAAESLWKRQHALKKFREAMQSLQQRLFIRWSIWGRAVNHWRRRKMDNAWYLWRRWMRDRRNMLRLLGESDEHNVISMKRRVIRRWFFQIREWRRQRALIHKSFNHGRIVMLQTRLTQWKQWKMKMGYPWWIARKYLHGQFYYWESTVREHFNWIRRVIFLEKDEYVAWATVTMQKYVRGKWGRKRAYQLKRMLALHRYRKVELAENMVIWNANAKIIQSWYRGFLRIRRLGRISIQLREQAEDRRLRLRKLRLQIKYLKMMIRNVGVEPKELKARVADIKKYKERSEKVVRSAAVRLRNGKKVLQKIIIQFGEARVKLKCDDMEHELRLEGAASRLTETEIETSIKRNHQFVIHEGLVAREKAYQFYRNRVQWQTFSKREAERMTDKHAAFQVHLDEYNKMDEEGKVREKINILSKLHTDSAVSRIVALLRGNQARLRFADMKRSQHEKILLKEWGALIVQTTWRRYNATKVAGLVRERHAFHAKNKRVIAVAKATGRPLGIYEQEKITVATLAKGGITEENLKKIEDKMNILTNPPWKRRMSDKQWKSLPQFVQRRVPERNHPALPEIIQARRVLLSFFQDMHKYIKDFTSVHCPWRETSVYTVIKMKLALKLVNARCRFRVDGGIKRYSLHTLLPVVLERGGSLVPIGKPTYFPKMPSLSPQTWGIWQIPMDHPSEDFDNLPRASDALMAMWRPSTAEQIAMALADDDGVDGEEVENVDQLYADALEAEDITEGKDHGLTGLIGGDVLGLTNDGMSVASYQSASTSGYSNAFADLNDLDDEVLSEEEEYPDIEMPLPMSNLEAEKLENKALDLLAKIRHTDPKKKRSRMKRVHKKRKERLRASGADVSNMAGDEGGSGSDDDDGGEMPLRPTDKDGIDLFDDTMSEISPPPSTLGGDEEEDPLDRMDVEDMDMEQLAAYEKKKIERIRKEQAENEAQSSGKLSVHALPDCLACKVRNDITRTAQRLCHDCNLPYCISCYRKSHKTGLPRFHHFTKYERRVDQFHEEDTRKKAHYETAHLKFLARTNPGQYRRQLAIADFKWSDILLRQAAQIFLEQDWQDTGEMDMPGALALLRELFKKRKNEVPSMRTALRQAWVYLESPPTINFPELVHTVPIYMRFFRHDAQVKLKLIEENGEGGDFDVSIFV
jgi:hypothetical protein